MKYNTKCDISSSKFWKIEIKIMEDQIENRKGTIMTIVYMQ